MKTKKRGPGEGNVHEKRRSFEFRSIGGRETPIDLGRVGPYGGEKKLGPNRLRE